MTGLAFLLVALVLILTGMVAADRICTLKSQLAAAKVRADNATSYAIAAREWLALVQDDTLGNDTLAMVAEAPDFLPDGWEA